MASFSPEWLRVATREALARKREAEGNRYAAERFRSGEWDGHGEMQLGLVISSFVVEAMQRGTVKEGPQHGNLDS